VNRWKRYLFRILRDPITGVDEIKTFGMKDGLAGFICITGNMIELDNVSSDHRFYP
jgi:hypothetical protein